MMQFLSSLSILLRCLCLKQLGPNVLPLFPTSTPECTSLGCQAALSSMSTGNGRERERESGHSSPGGPCLLPGAHISPTEDGARMCSLPRGDSCSFRTPVVLRSNMHRVSTEKSWRKPPSQCILVSGLPQECLQGYRRAWQGGVSPSWCCVVSVTVDVSRGAGVGTSACRECAGPRGSFQLTGLALLPTGYSHHGQVLHLDLGGRMGPGLVSPPPSLLSLSCPSQSPQSTCHQGWSSQPYLLSVSPVCL